MARTIAPLAPTPPHFQFSWHLFEEDLKDLRLNVECSWTFPAGVRPSSKNLKAELEKVAADGYVLQRGATECIVTVNCTTASHVPESIPVLIGEGVIPRDTSAVLEPRYNDKGELVISYKGSEPFIMQFDMLGPLTAEVAATFTTTSRVIAGALERAGVARDLAELAKVRFKTVQLSGTTTDGTPLDNLETRWTLRNTIFKCNLGELDSPLALPCRRVWIQSTSEPRVLFGKVLAERVRDAVEGFYCYEVPSEHAHQLLRIRGLAPQSVVVVPCGLQLMRSPADREYRLRAGALW